MCFVWILLKRGGWRQLTVWRRTACESLYADRIVGVKRLSVQAREWRDTEDSLMEED